MVVGVVVGGGGGGGGGVGDGGGEVHAQAFGCAGAFDLAACEEFDQCLDVWICAEVELG